MDKMIQYGNGTNSWQVYLVGKILFPNLYKKKFQASKYYNLKKLSIVSTRKNTWIFLSSKALLTFKTEAIKKKIMDLTAIKI